MAITFRAEKGRALTYTEMDQNFGSFLYSSSLSGNGQQITLHYTGSPAVPINSGSVSYSLIKGLTNAGSDRRIALFSGSSTIVTEQGLVVDESGSLGIGVNESNLPLNYRLDVSGSIRTTGTLLQTSDERLKEDIYPIDNAIDRVNAIDGVYFKWKESSKREVGVIAQQVNKVLPETVSEDGDGFLNVNYSGIVPLLVEAVKEQDSIIKDLLERIEKLEGK